MNEPHPPIFLDERGDIQAFATVAEAAAEVEAIDVLNDEYEAFDAIGQRLVLRARSAGDPVSIAVNQTAPKDPDELARRLRAYVDQVGADRIGLEPPTAQASLVQLVEAVARFHRR